MAKAAPTQKKKAEAGYAYKFKKVRDDGVGRSATKPRLHAEYLDTIVPAMIEEFGYKNAMTVPRLTKIVCNIGHQKIGRAHV